MMMSGTRFPADIGTVLLLAKPAVLANYQKKEKKTPVAAIAM